VGAVDGMLDEVTEVWAVGKEVERSVGTDELSVDCINLVKPLESCDGSAVGSTVGSSLGTIVGSLVGL